MHLGSKIFGVEDGQEKLKNERISRMYENFMSGTEQHVTTGGDTVLPEEASFRHTESQEEDFYEDSYYEELYKEFFNGQSTFHDLDYNLRDFQEILEVAIQDEQERSFARKLHFAYRAGQRAEVMCQSQYQSQPSIRELLKQFKNIMLDDIYGTNSLMMENSLNFDPQFQRTRRKFTLTKLDQNRKRRLCRHFLKGHCKRGRGCDFLHDPTIFCDDQQKVFLGGLPEHITQKTLRKKLARQGYKVLNSPKIFRGFTPQVCLASVKQAQRLISNGSITIDGATVDVRPYRPYNHLFGNANILMEDSRSVFLGGLSSGTTRQMIKDDVEKLGVRVMNHPIVKNGFTPQVTFETEKQAQRLVRMKQIWVNGTRVDVRPFIRRTDKRL